MASDTGNNDALVWDPNDLLSVPSTPEGIASIAFQMLHAPDGVLTDGMRKDFFRRVQEQSLEWMMTGDLEKVHEFFGRLNDGFRSNFSDALQCVPQRDRLLYQLVTMTRLMIEFVSFQNTPLFLSQLFGLQRRSWCDALAFAVERRDGAKISDFVAAGIFKERASAEQVLRQMRKIGFFESTTEEGSERYNVSFGGFHAYQALKDAHSSVE